MPPKRKAKPQKKKVQKKKNAEAKPSTFDCRKCETTYYGSCMDLREHDKICPAKSGTIDQKQMAKLKAQICKKKKK